MKLRISRAAALLAMALSALSSAHAFDAASERAERDRIKAEREQAEAAYVTRERECRQKFVVTPCLDQARRDRRQTMDRLRQQQEVLDEALRKQRAAQRVDEIRSKVSQEDAKQREATAKVRRQRAEAAASSASAASAPGAIVDQHPPSAASKPASTGASTVEAQAKKKAAAYDKRQQDAQEHRAAVERRNAEKAAGGKVPAKSLPTPASAAP